MNKALGIMLRIGVDALFSVLVLRLPETVFLFVVLPLIVYNFYILHKGLSIITTLGTKAGKVIILCLLSHITLFYGLYFLFSL